MDKKSKFERMMMLFGLVAGIVVWLKRAGTPKVLEQGASTVSHKAQDLVGEARHKAETLVHAGADAKRDDATGSGDRAQDAGEEGAAFEPDLHAGEDTVAPGVGGDVDATEYQHGALGGIPADAATSEGDSLAVSRDEGASDESAFAYGARPYGADVSDEGVILTPESDRDREDVPLDEGFPNLAEPGDVDASLTAPDVDDDTSDSGAYVGDTSDMGDYPAASRGFAEEAEFTPGREDVDAYRDDLGGEFDSLDEEDISGAGGEVDLLNDEAPAHEDTGFSIVDSPEEAVSADAAGFSEDEMTLGLRDSESLQGESGTGDHLDVSGSFAEAEATEDVPATMGVAEDAESGDALRDSFVTGHEADSLDAEFDYDAGATGDAAGTAGAFDRYDPGSSTGDVPVGDAGHGEHLDVSGNFDEAEETETIPAAPAGDASGLAGEELRDSFVTGDDAVDASEAAPGDVGHEAAGIEGDRVSAAHSAAWSTPAGISLSPSGAPEGAGEGETGDASGGADEGPATGVDEELSDAVSESGDSGLGHDLGGDDLSDAGVETLTEGEEDVADAVDHAVDGQPGDEANDDQATDEPAPFISTPGDLGGGDAFDPASAQLSDMGTSDGVIDDSTRTDQAGAWGSEVSTAAGDSGETYRFGTSSGEVSSASTYSADDFRPDADDDQAGDVAEDVQHQVYRAPSADTGLGQETLTDLSGDSQDDGDDESDEVTGDETRARKSRRQRRKESNWVPAGAVKGDGTATCPSDFPIKGNANSRIYHRPTDPSYDPTIPEYCFATEDDAQKAGFRAPKGH